MSVAYLFILYDHCSQGVLTVNLSKNSPKNMSAQRVCFYVLGDVKFLTIFSFFIGSLKAADLLQLM